MATLPVTVAAAWTKAEPVAQVDAPAAGSSTTVCGSPFNVTVRAANPHTERDEHGTIAVRTRDSGGTCRHQRAWPRQQRRVFALGAGRCCRPLEGHRGRRGPSQATVGG